MTKSEAGKLGSIKSQQIYKKNKEIRIVEYNKNPNICKECLKKIPYEHKNNSFCNKSCAASYNNKNRPKHHCKFCNNELTKKKQFCDNKCQQEFLYYESVNMYLKNIIDKPRNIRRFLTETIGYKCSSCQINNWNGKSIVLEVEHIDGNSKNNRPENLTFLCPNCHSQTETYKGKNKGNGRYSRMKRYYEGKSY